MKNILEVFCYQSITMTLFMRFTSFPMACKTPQRNVHSRVCYSISALLTDDVDNNPKDDAGKIHTHTHIQRYNKNIKHIRGIQNGHIHANHRPKALTKFLTNRNICKYIFEDKDVNDSSFIFSLLLFYQSLYFDIKCKLTERKKNIFTKYIWWNGQFFLPETANAIFHISRFSIILHSSSCGQFLFLFKIWTNSKYGDFDVSVIEHWPISTAEIAEWRRKVAIRYLLSGTMFAVVTKNALSYVVRWDQSHWR